MPGQGLHLLYGPLYYIPLITPSGDLSGDDDYDDNSPPQITMSTQVLASNSFCNVWVIFFPGLWLNGQIAVGPFEEQLD